MKNFRLERDYQNKWNVSREWVVRTGDNTGYRLRDDMALLVLDHLRADARYSIHRRYRHRVSINLGGMDMLTNTWVAGWKYKGVRPMVRMPRMRYVRKDQSQ